MRKARRFEAPEYLPRQQWRKTDTEFGYATYTSVQSINDGTPRCLTGRGLVGFPLVTAQPCVPGARNQQWRLGISGDFKLRLNGLVAAHQTSTGKGVVMQFFDNQANQKWHTHDA